MGRPIRPDDVGGWFHVVNRGAGRADIFLHDRDRIEFGRLLGEAHDRFGVEVHAYCLMSNHYHLLVACPSGGLSDAMHLVGGVYSRHLNERVGRDGPVFRGRYFARAVLTPAYQLRVVRYIHRNPLSFLPAGRLVTYRWSSLRTYLGFRPRPHWMRTDAVDGLVGGVEGMQMLVGVVGAPTDDPPCARELAWAVDLMIDEHVGESASQGVARTVMSELLDRVDETIAQQLSGLLAFPTANAERSARSRARRRIRENPDLERVVNGVLDLVA